MTQAVQVPGVGTLQFPDGMSQADMAAAIQKNFPHIHDAPATGAQQEPALGWKDYAAALPETVAHAASGAAGAVLGGLGSLIDTPLYMAGLTKTRPDKVVSNTEQALTYEPRTAGGQKVSDLLGYPGAKLAQGANWVGDKAQGAAQAAGLSPELSGTIGGLASSGIQSLPLLIGARLPTLTGSAPAGLAPEVAAARSLGIRLTPTQAQVPGLLGSASRALESLAGSAKLERTISRANAPVVDRAAGTDIGLPRGIAANPATVRSAKSAPNAVYNQVRSIGPVTTDANYSADIAGIRPPGGNSFAFDTPADVNSLKQGYGGLSGFDANDAVDKLQQLRRDGFKNQRAPYNPQQQALGDAQLAAAQAIESQLERSVASTQPNLLSDFRQARTQLAKIHNVEQALRGGKGEQVSSRTLAALQERGAPLSGNLKTIADTYSAFPRALQDLRSIRNSGPFSALDLGVGGPLSVLNPKVALPLLLAPVARGALASRAFQNIAFGAPRAALPPSFPALLNAARAAPVLSSESGSERRRLLGAPY